MIRTLVAALAVLIGTAATAADYRPGPYAGLTVGYAAGALTNNSADLTTDGIPVSGVLGYTHIIAGTNMLIGIEGEAILPNISGKQSVNGFTLEANSDYTLAIKGRAGMVFGPALIYGTAGPSWTKSKLEGFGLEDDHLTLGIVAGGGVDLQITPTIIMRLEAVRQMSFGQEWTLGAQSTKLDAGETTLRVGVIINLQ